MPCPKTQHQNNVPILRGEKRDISLKNPAPSGIRNRTTGSDIDKALRSSHCAMSLSSYSDIVNIKHLYNIYTMSDRWADVVHMLCKCFVYTGNQAMIFFNVGRITIVAWQSHLFFRRLLQILLCWVVPREMHLVIIIDCTCTNYNIIWLSFILFWRGNYNLYRPLCTIWLIKSLLYVRLNVCYY